MQITQPGCSQAWHWGWSEAGGGKGGLGPQIATFSSCQLPGSLLEHFLTLLPSPRAAGLSSGLTAGIQSDQGSTACQDLNSGGLHPDLPSQSAAFGICSWEVSEKLFESRKLGTTWMMGPKGLGQNLAPQRSWAKTHCRWTGCTPYHIQFSILNNFVSDVQMAAFWACFHWNPTSKQ